MPQYDPHVRAMMDEPKPERDDGQAG
jgi:hypothetical protein